MTKYKSPLHNPEVTEARYLEAVHNLEILLTYQKNIPIDDIENNARYRLKIMEKRLEIEERGKKIGKKTENRLTLK